jgi:organic radical activating enzyme
MEKRLEVCKKTHKAYFDDSKTYMRSIDVMVTTKCSLKCNNCSNLMQYYTNPEHTDHEKILEALNIIDKNVDGISEFRLIGGEPLMNKGWANIVTTINEKHPNGQIFIYTNGTIAPKEDQLKSFDSDLVNFIITDYGKLSRNADKMTDLLNKYNISYDRSPAQGWVDCSSIKHHRRSIKDNEEVFKQCCVKYIYTLLQGKLYRCPFIANAANLNAIPDNPANYVDLFSKKIDIKQEIKRLVKVVKFFPGCDFCVGRPYDPTSSVGYDGKGIIEAGQQISHPIPYRLYK